ncbi:hypothetical protein [Paraclostridium sordellii]|uniref:hypothetical protein n=1 Tax=Paraclostridium sordellii TaxID=1505 RepID=UPI000386758D|nr:hypothetical protein [Paeniclostridium sordellii]AUO31648.1 hypothetical protein [Paeniclostridium sordellii]AUO31742.1 hypothetical protein [Paeniclostridium sordellii]EPZ61119.1 hypothetical protein H476_0315 [[Clostridium] sordellii VPI 9048] [Paeniclostridium sordellii VPI 9048]CEK40089.1 hypothetical protein JGS6382_PCS1300481 (plasmid) [[Clostridium] sordellii] [Paeniclostridium sordellii]
MVIKTIFECEGDFDYIYCPDNIKFDINKFFTWIYEDETHPFWAYNSDGSREGVEYRGDAIIYWINNFVIEKSQEKSYMIKSFSNENLDYDVLVNL